MAASRSAGARRPPPRWPLSSWHDSGAWPGKAALVSNGPRTGCRSGQLRASSCAAFPGSCWSPRGPWASTVIWPVWPRSGFQQFPPGSWRMSPSVRLTGIRGCGPWDRSRPGSLPAGGCPQMPVGVGRVWPYRQGVGGGATRLGLEGPGIDQDARHFRLPPPASNSAPRRKMVAPSQGPCARVRSKRIAGPS